MLVIVGLSVLLFAGVIAFVGVLSNAGAAHPLTENFSVFGFHITGSTGTLFLFGIVVGAVALLALSVLWAGARRTVDNRRASRRVAARFQREMAFTNRDTFLEHQQRVDTPTRNLQPIHAARVDAANVATRSTRSTPAGRSSP